MALHLYIIMKNTHEAFKYLFCDISFENIDTFRFCFLFKYHTRAEEYSESCQTSKTERFAKLITEVCIYGLGNNVLYRETFI